MNFIIFNNMFASQPSELFFDFRMVSGKTQKSIEKTDCIL